MKNKLINAGISILMLLMITSPVIAATCSINGEQIPCNVFWANYGWIFIILIVIAIIFTGFWVWMLIDCIKRENFKDKTLWILIILLATWIGSIVYYFVVKRKSK